MRYECEARCRGRAPCYVYIYLEAPTLLHSFDTAGGETYYNASAKNDLALPESSRKHIAVEDRQVMTDRVCSLPWRGSVCT